jgi:uncharacterized protein (TIGR03086 family)
VTAPGALAFGPPALAACQAVLREIGPDDLARPTPCSEFDVAAVVGHLERSMVLLAGSADVVLEPTAASSAEQRVVPLAAAAVQAWRDRGLDGEVAVGSRTRPADRAYAIVVLELVVHGWDLATALGRPFTVSDDVVEYLQRYVPLLITAEARGRGFAAEIPVRAEAAPLARLIAFTGRQP